MSHIQTDNVMLAITAKKPTCVPPGLADLLLHGLLAPAQPRHGRMDAVAIVRLLDRAHVNIQRTKHLAQLQLSENLRKLVWMWYPVLAAALLALLRRHLRRGVHTGSKGRGCKELHFLQMAHDPLHHCSTKAHAETVGIGSPASFSAMSLASGFGRSLSKKNFFATRVLSAARRFLYAVTSLLSNSLKALLRLAKAACHASAAVFTCWSTAALRGSRGCVLFSFKACAWNFSRHSSGTRSMAAL